MNRRRCDTSKLNIKWFKRDEAVTSMLKVHTTTHCTGATNTNNGVDEKYVGKLLKTYEHVFIAESGENVCGFLFLSTVKKGNDPMYAYIDLVCSSDGIGWKLLDFAENWVHTDLKLDVIYLHAIDSKKIICMYASRGYREVQPGMGCKTNVTRVPTAEREKRLGIRMSKCVKNGKEITTKKLYPSVCDPAQNRNRYTTPHGFNISKDELEPKKPSRSIQKPKLPKLSGIEKLFKKAQQLRDRRKV
jgi:hypothetical protein